MEEFPDTTFVYAIDWEGKYKDEELHCLAFRFQKVNNKEILVSSIDSNNKRIRIINQPLHKDKEYNDITSNCISNLMSNNDTEVYRLTSSMSKKYIIKAIRGIVKYIFIDMLPICKDFLDREKDGKKIAEKVYNHDIENYTLNRFISRTRAIYVLAYLFLGISRNEIVYSTNPRNAFRDARRLLLRYFYAVD